MSERRKPSRKPKGEGFDVKVQREILRLRKLDREDREEHESLVDLYLRAMESASTPDVRAAQCSRTGGTATQPPPHENRRAHYGAVGGSALRSIFIHSGAPSALLAAELRMSQLGGFRAFPGGLRYDRYPAQSGCTREGRVGEMEVSVGRRRQNSVAMTLLNVVFSLLGQRRASNHLGNVECVTG
jgi:hypothetical protein